MRIGMQLKIARIEKEWDIATLSDKSKVAKSSISEIETGKKNPTAMTIQKLCNAMGYDLKIIRREATA